MILFYDTETTGFVVKGQPLDYPSQPHMVQYAGILAMDDGKPVRAFAAIIRQDGWSIPQDATAVHGISNDLALAAGIDEGVILAWHWAAMEKAKVMVAHNIGFDRDIMEIQRLRSGRDIWKDKIKVMESADTMKMGIPVCKIPGRYSGYKWPKLEELHRHLFGEDFPAHDALEDVRACMRCYFRMKEMEEKAKEQAEMDKSIKNDVEYLSGPGKGPPEEPQPIVPAPAPQASGGPGISSQQAGGSSGMPGVTSRKVE